MFYLHLLEKELWLEGGQGTMQVWPKEGKCTTDDNVTACVCDGSLRISRYTGRLKGWPAGGNVRCRSMRCEVSWWSVRSSDEAWGRSMRREVDRCGGGLIDEVWGRLMRCTARLIDEVWGQAMRCEVDRWDLCATLMRSEVNPWSVTSSVIMRVPVRDEWF